MSSEKRYKVTIPHTIKGDNPWPVDTTFPLTEAQLDTLIANAQAAKAQAEADKPKAWDFGKGIHTGKLRIRGNDELWSATDTPLRVMACPSDKSIHILGNLKKIIEEEGKIVIGMEPDEARKLRMILKHSQAFLDVEAVDMHLRDALARYERNKP